MTVITADEIHKPTVRTTAFKNAYRNNKTVWLMPTRGMIPLRVHVSLRNMAWLPNTMRAHIEIENKEVSDAYNTGFEMALKNPECQKFPFVWTYEEDNIQPQNVFFKLFDAIWKCIDCGDDMPSDKDGNPAEPWVCQNGHRGLDAVGGLYCTKSDPPMWMAFGDPSREELDFGPHDVSLAQETGSLIEVNGLAMGCTLWRKALFGKIEGPWFKTLTGAEEGVKIGSYTQDLYACRRFKEETDARFAVHCGVAVGHMDVTTGEIF